MNRPSPKEWRKLREIVNGEAGYRCEKCGKAGRMEVDHIIPLHKGGSNARANLQALCRTCHIKKTGKERRQRLIDSGQYSKQFAIQLREWEIYRKNLIRGHIK